MSETEITLAQLFPTLGTLGAIQFFNQAAQTVKISENATVRFYMLKALTQYVALMQSEQFKKVKNDLQYIRYFKSFQSKEFRDDLANKLQLLQINKLRNLPSL